MEDMVRVIHSSMQHLSLDVSELSSECTGLALRIDRPILLRNALSPIGSKRLSL